MTKTQKQLSSFADGSADIAQWIESLNIPPTGARLLHETCQLAYLTGGDHQTPYGDSCFLHGLETAEILNALHFDHETIAAAVMYPIIEFTDLSLDDLERPLGKPITSLIFGAQQISVIAQMQHNTRNTQQIDNIRKMLLAMVRDARVVVLKLADRLSIMRALRNQASYTRHTLAQETMDIYAPLANRLGLHAIKWELEDLSFFYLETEEYKKIAKKLAEKRMDRDAHVHSILATLTHALKAENIQAELKGRAKHIYSIKRKMLRKNVGFDEIYDAIAVRVLVETIENCYKALSIAHTLWTPIEKEFDDYIFVPKSNGYQSIHTAVTDQTGKHFEVQIRTFKMHEDSEMGVAAHWMYKEGKSKQTAYEEKIAWLRNLLEWQKELSHDEQLPEELEKNVFTDRVYVFTPLGDIIDLPAGATPLDFAYHIHTAVGHHCKGAKINGKIVPLTHPLQMGDRVEILTNKTSTPSRDWLAVKQGYLKTSAARAKVLSWFKKQDFEKHVAEGRATFEREVEHLKINSPNLSRIATRLNFKTPELMFASLGHGSLRLAQITNLISSEIPLVEKKPLAIKSEIKTTKGSDYITVQGVGNLLSKIARCCKPLPGDPIIGYITQGHGVTIHHRDCENLKNLSEEYASRLVEVEWNEQSRKKYPIDIEIIATDHSHLLHEITTIFANEKINVTHFASTPDKKNMQIKITLTIELDHLELLPPLFAKIRQLPQVSEVKRQTLTR
ncbi:MAG: GTP diphosphokinase [Gammaproteobacteria bacterium]|nr:GTP diphosphokinase [Gammaproteobacteria bacterium]